MFFLGLCPCPKQKRKDIAVCLLVWFFRCFCRLFVYFCVFLHTFCLRFEAVGDQHTTFVSWAVRPCLNVGAGELKQDIQCLKKLQSIVGTAPLHGIEFAALKCRFSRSSQFQVPTVQSFWTFLVLLKVQRDLIWISWSFNRDSIGNLMVF